MQNKSCDRYIDLLLFSIRLIYSHAKEDAGLFIDAKKKRKRDASYHPNYYYLFIYYAELPFHSIMRLAHSLTD